MQAGLGSLGRVFVVSLFVGIMTTVGFVLCIVPGVIIMCMNWVAVPVAVMEQPGATAALTRSQDLTAGTRLPVFAVVLLIGMIVGMVSFVGGVAVVALAGVTGSAALGEQVVHLGRLVADQMGEHLSFELAVEIGAGRRRGQEELRRLCLVLRHLGPRELLLAVRPILEAYRKKFNRIVSR